MKNINTKTLCFLLCALSAMTMSLAANAAQPGGARSSQRFAATAANPGVASTYEAFNRVVKNPAFTELVRSGDARGAKTMLIQNGAPTSLPLLVYAATPVWADPTNHIVPNCSNWGTRTWWQWKPNLPLGSYIPDNIGNGNYGTYITQVVCIENSSEGTVVWQWN